MCLGTIRGKLEDGEGEAFDGILRVFSLKCNQEMHNFLANRMTLCTRWPAHGIHTHDADVTTM